MQEDLYNLEAWCNENNLELNVKKCCFMTFSRKLENANSSYIINKTLLSQVQSFVDLGVIFDPKLAFNQHIDGVISRANFRLSLIRRWSCDFNDIFITKTLYQSLVRSILEFACIVWEPYLATYTTKLESVQKQFLLFALRSLPWGNPRVLPKYEHRLLLIDMVTLSDRRKLLGSIFVNKLLNGEINSSFLLSLVRIKVRSRLIRSNIFLKTRALGPNYLINEPFNKLCLYYNEFGYIFDFNKCNSYCKKNILTVFRNKYQSMFRN